MWRRPVELARAANTVSNSALLLEKSDIVVGGGYGCSGVFQMAFSQVPINRGSLHRGEGGFILNLTKIWSNLAFFTSPVPNGFLRFCVLSPRPGS